MAQLEAELAQTRLSLEESEREKELSEARAAQQLQEVQQAIQSGAKMVQDLHKQVCKLVLYYRYIYFKQING